MTGLHHASLIRANSVSDLVINNHDANITEVNDIYVESFGIDDARELIKKAYQRPAEKSEQLLIVRTDFITHESQNSLLKLLEEPPTSTRIIFVLPKDIMLLPTLNSRLQVDSSYAEVKTAINLTFIEFAGLDYKDRITMLEQAIKQKNLAWQRLIKKGLIDYLRHANSKSSSSLELEYVTRTLLTRGASNKMLLEQIALVLPARLQL
jgi:DNA polymerase III, delta subunit